MIVVNAFCMLVTVIFFAAAGWDLLWLDLGGFRDNAILATIFAILAGLTYR